MFEPHNTSAIFSEVVLARFAFVLWVAPTAINRELFIHPVSEALCIYFIYSQYSR
nr:MAG TPA: hypothetical protein [Caudoviricetes sp.]